MVQRILLLEDDEKLGQQVSAQLQEAGYVVEWHKSAEPPFEPDFNRFHLVILDLMLPGTYGLDILKTMRASSEVPVLIVSARNDSADVVRAFKLGADDYLKKPFWPNELLARVSARLRRPSMNRVGVCEINGLRIDSEARTVHVEGVLVDFTRVEFDLLAALALRPGAAVSRDWLMEHVLGVEEVGEQRTLDVHFSRLRKKIGGHRILTVWGIGYRLNTENVVEETK